MFVDGTLGTVGNCGGGSAKLHMVKYTPGNTGCDSLTALSMYFISDALNCLLTELWEQTGNCKVRSAKLHLVK